MRKYLGLFFALLIVWTGRGMSAAEPAREKTGFPDGKEAETRGETPPSAELTIMVYLCGGNLETIGAAASHDVMEMAAAMKTTENVNLVFMAGGARRWWREPMASSRSTGIYQIAHEEVRLLREEGRTLNMGDPETLQLLVEDTVKRFSSEHYALILWDHGGGVLDGVCRDENFAGDNLTFSELKSAIEDANLGQKLSWIGFDACLMGSMELAVGLSSVADYMIASQDVEPSSGWNYSFLREIQDREQSAETGRRIVDAYFEGREESKEPLTLSCVDLRKTVLAGEALGDFFSEVEKGISEETYPALSVSREAVRSFGEGLKGTGRENNGSDLVDAEDLIQRIEGQESKKEAALSALRDAVIYHRANMENACGLTLYHPWQNKGKYLGEWGASYRSLNLIEGYTRYIQSFGTLLNEEALVRWKDLYTRAEGKNEKGNHRFSLQLTEEESSHVASAQLMIVYQSGFGSELTNGVVTVGVANAEMTEDGLLEAEYDEKSVYVQRENGQLFGPISYTRTSDGAYDAILALFTPKDEYGPGNGTIVLYYLDKNDPSEIAQIRVWDDATDSYTTRLAFEQEQYRMVSFWNLNRVYPEEENGVLPDYYDWSRDGGLYSSHLLALPDDWHFVVRHEQLTGSQLYAMFRITDVQQNTYCSVPVPIENDNLADYHVALSQEKVPDTEISLSGYMDYSGEQKMHLRINLQNTGDETAKYYVDGMILNHERELSWTIYGTEIPAGKTLKREWDAPVLNLIGLEKIETIGFEITRETETGKKTEKLLFPVEGIDLHRVRFPTSMGTAESDEITMDLLKIEPSDMGGFEVKALVQNHGKESIFTEWLMMNQLQLKGNAYEEIRSGESRVITYYWDNGLMWYDFGLEPLKTENIHISFELLRHWMALRGEKTIDRFGAVFSNKEGYSVTRYLMVQAGLKQVWEVREVENPGAIQDIQGALYSEKAAEMRHLVLLAENDRVSVKLRHLVIGDRVMVAVIEMENRTEEMLRVGLSGILVNGESVPDDFFANFEIMPGCVMLSGYTISIDEIWQKGEEISSILFSVYDNGKDMGKPVSLLLQEPVEKSEKDEITWVSSEKIKIMPAR